ESATFLLTLAQALHMASVPSDVIQRRLSAVARSIGMKIDVVALQSFLVAEVDGGVAPRVALRRIPASPHWNLRKVAALSALCDGLASRTMSAGEGRARLSEILTAPARYPKALVVFAYGVYGAAVAARIGGATLEMVAGGLVGLVAGLLHFGT